MPVELIRLYESGGVTRLGKGASERRRCQYTTVVARGKAQKGVPPPAPPPPISISSLFLPRGRPTEQKPLWRHLIALSLNIISIAAAVLHTVFFLFFYFRLLFISSFIFFILSFIFFFLYTSFFSNSGTFLFLIFFYFFNSLWNDHLFFIL